MAEKIKVLVVDDSAMMCEGIRIVLNKAEDIEVVGKVYRGKEVLEKINELHPDCITLDIEMPEMDGWQVLQEVMQKNPMPIVMLSSALKDDPVAQAKAVKLGAAGIVEKPSGSLSLDIKDKGDDIIKTVRDAITNFKYNKF